MDKLRFVELFAGIGGFSLGFERVGMECVGHVEIEPYAQKVLLKHWPDVPLMEDVKNVKGTEFGQIDLLCGGFPCQDLSVAGKRAGIDGDRSSLFKEIIRIASICRPKYIIFENVVQLVNRTDWFGAFLGEIAKIGYNAEWQTVQARDCGAIHERKRVFVVAYPMCERREGLEQSRGVSKIKQRGWCSQENLREIFNSPFKQNDLWPQPLLRRVDDGVPHRLDRLKCIGNALVPQIAEYIGQCILEREKAITYLSD